MTEKEIVSVQEMASNGLCGKNDIIEALEGARGILEDYEKQKKALQDEIDTFTFHACTSDGKKAKENSAKLDECSNQMIEVNVQIKLYKDIVESLQKSFDSYKNFKKKVFFDNVRLLLNENEGVKIGMIEKEAGVSIGSMSRMEKEGNTTDPSAEFLCSASKLFGVSLDVLANVDLTELNPTEKYIVTFIQKLNKDTVEDKLDWNKETSAALNRMELDENGFVPHVLFSSEGFYEDGENDYPEYLEEIRFISNTFEVHTAIHGDCYNLKLKNQSTLYLMNISECPYTIGDPNAFAKELWIYTPGVGKQFLVSNRENAQIGALVDLLYDTISRNMSHPKVKKEVRSIIDAFMHDDWEDDNNDDELPFN